MEACLEDSVIHFDNISSTTSTDKYQFVFIHSWSEISQKMLNFELYCHYHVCDVNQFQKLVNYQEYMILTIVFTVSYVKNEVLSQNKNK